MAQPIRTVAVLVATPALSSILSVTLAGAPSLRVRPFDSELGLVTYLRLAQAELVVTDFDSVLYPADQVALELKGDARVDRGRFQIIALASALAPDTRTIAARAGIDEIIMKPMSPKYLVERVLARLAQQPAPPDYLGPERRGPRRQNWASFGDNVVPLFGRSPEAQI